MQPEQRVTLVSAKTAKYEKELWSEQLQVPSESLLPFASELRELSQSPQHLLRRRHHQRRRRVDLK